MLNAMWYGDVYKRKIPYLWGKKYVYEQAWLLGKYLHKYGGKKLINIDILHDS